MCLSGFIFIFITGCIQLEGRLGVVVVVVVVKILGVFFGFKGEKRKSKKRKEKRQGMSMDTCRDEKKRKKIYPSALLLTCIAVEFMSPRAGI